MGRKTKNQNGFTVVELVVALVVASLLVISVNTVYTNQVYLAERGRDLTLANSYVEGKVEALRSAGYLTLDDGTTDISDELPDELSPPRNGSLQISSPSSGIKEVLITVTYNSQGQDRTETYTSLIGELGAAQY